MSFTVLTQKQLNKIKANLAEIDELRLDILKTIDAAGDDSPASAPVEGKKKPGRPRKPRSVEPVWPALAAGLAE